MRTQRYKYIRNFYFNEGAALPSDIHASPSFRAMRRALVLGLLNEEQKAILDHARASEEFYDLQTDPDEFNNLAGDPAHGDVLQELRHTVEQWSESTADVSPEQRRPTRRLYRWL